MLGVLLLLLLAVSLALATAMRRLVTGALASIPGPRLAAVSRLWYAYQVRNGRLLQLATTLHRQYGPAVRVGPNEVWFDSPEAFRAIYSPSHGFAKSDFYLATVLFRPETDWRHPRRLAFPDTLDLLSERDMTRYRQQRRLVGPVYHAANVAKFGGAVDAVLARAVAQLRALDGAELDLKEWMHIIAVECLGAVVLAWSPQLLERHSDGGTSRASYANWRRKSVFGLFPGLVVADFHAPWIVKAFAAVWGLVYKTDKNFQSFFPAVGGRIAARIRKARRAATAAEKTGRPPPQPQSRDLLGDLVNLHRAKPAFSETYLRRMAVTNFGAGHETMCSALTAAVAMIASHPDVLQAVAAEVRGPRPATAGTADAVAAARAAAAACPVTAASIREAQRLHPAIGMALPRVVPAGGPPLELHGHQLPPGTVVGCSPLALHRNPAVFGADADAFRPGRWLDADAATRRRMERVNLTWGGGARTCPGRYLAELIVYKTVATLVREFDVDVAMPATDQIRYYFLAMLTGVTVRFRRRRDDQDAGSMR